MENNNTEKYGIENCDIEKASPLLWFRIGYAMGCKSSRVGICCDNEEMSELAAGAIKTGARCSGAKIYNFGVGNLPIMRNAIRFYKLEPSVYVSTTKNISNVRFLDGRGIQIPPQDAVDADVLNPKFKEINIKSVGGEIDLSEYKTHYMRKIINSVKSEQFNINMCLSTKSKTVSDIIETVLKELYPRLNPSARNLYEFCGSISENGELLTLSKSDGTELSREQTLYVMIYVLIHDSPVRTFVLPDYISEYAEAAILKPGGNVIRTSGNDSEIMGKILSSGSAEQMLMQYDGVYAAVKILDFLNRFEISFERLCDHLPDIFKAEAEVLCDTLSSADIMRLLKREYHGVSQIHKDGVRIEFGGGVTVIFPSKSGSIIKIISESQSMETAEEISTLFKNKIKTLANT